jgi:hypothetical protein
MSWSDNRLLKYRKHRASGQAVVTLNGRDFYLGPHNTKASKLEYDPDLDAHIDYMTGAANQIPSLGLTDTIPSQQVKSVLLCRLWKREVLAAAIPASSFDS